MTIEQNLQKGFYENSPDIEEDKKIKEEIDKKIQELINKLLVGQEQFLGKGMSAEVHFLPDNERVCFKITTHREVMGKNAPKPRIPVTKQDYVSRRPSHSPKDEGVFLSNLVLIESAAKVPRPFEWAVWEAEDEGDTYIVKEKIEVLAMERLYGPSLTNVIDEGAEIPESFNFERFFKELRDFVEEMHNRGIFHHDLHTGNIMIDKKTGSPRVIDFGHAGHDEYNDDDIEYRGGKAVEYRLKKDLESIDVLETALSRYLHNSK